MIILQQPLTYLVATAAMCLVDAIGALPSLRFTGTKAEGWHVPAAKVAMEAGDLLYAGKYSAPDYELLLAGGCDLTVQSTMVLQAPEVQEKFKELGIPMFIDMSGLESHPLGRTEWIKVYGALLGKEDEAEQVFTAQKKAVEAVVMDADQAVSVAFFYVNSNGAVVSKAAGIISCADWSGGGKYLGPDSRTLIPAIMDMETFYVCKDADYLIYNATEAAPQNVGNCWLRTSCSAISKPSKRGRHMLHPARCTNPPIAW